MSESEFLDLLDSMEITGAVGKWHLAAHIPECFSKFSLNFVEGAGVMDIPIYFPFSFIILSLYYFSDIFSTLII